VVSRPKKKSRKPWENGGREKLVWESEREKRGKKRRDWKQRRRARYYKRQMCEGTVMWILETADVQTAVRCVTQAMRHCRDLEMPTELYCKAVASHRPRKAANKLVLCGKN